MKLTITEAHNDRALASNLDIANNIITRCPTALAYAEAKGLPEGSIYVGYSNVGTIGDGEKLLAHFDGPLLRAVQRFTRSRPRARFTGTFEIREVS